jgi:putative acetyltransferase
MSGVLIRDERPADHNDIHALTLAAFAPMSFSDGTEADIVRKLRADGDLTISLVAEENRKVVGHIAFSPVTIDGTHNRWFGLGPISVKPAMQRRGIGRKMVLAGLELLRERGAAGCALIGDPDIYGRFGFDSDGQLKYRKLDTRLVQRIAFGGVAPSGELRFAPAFEG